MLYIYSLAAILSAEIQDPKKSSLELRSRPFWRQHGLGSLDGKEIIVKTGQQTFREIHPLGGWRKLYTGSCFLRGIYLPHWLWGYHGSCWSLCT